MMKLLTPPAAATGIEEPLRWLEQPATDVKPPLLRSPEFYYEVEARRLATELYPQIAATASKPPAKLAEADLADFREALEKKILTPPDPAAAQEAHRAWRALIDAKTAGDKPAEDGATAKPATPDKPAEVPPAEFPSEFSEYHKGAREFQFGNWDEAKAAFDKLLARPAAERHYRTTWAFYMLGRIAVENSKWEEARTAFAKVRQAAQEGFPDPLKLTGDSFGWEAYAWLKDDEPIKAVPLYLQQLASGDSSAVNSMSTTMGQIVGEKSDAAALAPIAGDPLLQRVCTAGTVADMQLSNDITQPKEDDFPAQWLRALEAIDAKSVRDTDVVAWIAYGRGDYKLAQRWLGRAEPTAPYALWLRAKFALRDGKTDEALKLLGQVVAKMPPQPRVEAYELLGTALSPADTARAQLGLLRLSRAEFVDALRLFLDGGLWSDAFYLADGVLTVEELQSFIKKEIPKLYSPREAAPGEAALSPVEALSPDPQIWHQFMESAGPTWMLRGILARRLVRLERYKEARDWFEPEQQKLLDEYTGYLGKAGNDKASKPERAAAYWSAAKLMFEHGSELSDYFDPITIASRSSGRDVETGPNPDLTLRYGKPVKFVPPLSAAEQQRLKKNAAPALHRYYSTYLAADLGWRSALLMSDNDEETAKRLNAAGSWLKNADEKAADRFYQAIERRCSKTETGAEAVKKHWFVGVEEETPERQ